MFNVNSDSFRLRMDLFESALQSSLRKMYTTDSSFAFAVCALDSCNIVLDCLKSADSRVQILVLLRNCQNSINDFPHTTFNSFTLNG